TQSDRHKPARGYHGRYLPLMANREKGIRRNSCGRGGTTADFGRQLEPPMCAEVSARRLWGRRRAEGHPAFRKHSLRVPDSVVQKKFPKTQPVARRRQHGRGADERARRVWLENRARHPERFEEHTAGPI